MATSKLTLNTSISEILTRNGIELSSTLAIELLGLVSTSKSSKTKEPKALPNQPLVNGIEFNPEIHKPEDITEIFCQWFKEYRPVKNEDGSLNFSKSTKSKTGYHYESKEAEKHWKAYAKEIAQIKEDIILEKNAVLDGVKTVDEAKAEISILEAQLKQLEADRLNKVNHPSISAINSSEVIKPSEVQEDIEYIAVKNEDGSLNFSKSKEAETPKKAKKSKKGTEEI